MSLLVARKKRTNLFATIAALLLTVGLVSLISIDDPSGAILRIGMIMVSLAAGLVMRRSWELIPVALLAWLTPNFGRSLVDDSFQLFSITMLLEAAGVLAIAGLASVARESLKELESEHLLMGAQGEGARGLNPETGVYEADQLRPFLEAELARSRRFGRTFSLVLVGIDEMRQKYDYRDPASLDASIAATARLLRNTRHNVDRVFHYGENGFAMLLPESSENDVVGMVRRLRRLARTSTPSEGEPGGPLPAHYGATFFPSRATTVEDLMRRAEIALKIAASSKTRYQLDSAAAPELPPAETLRRPADEVMADLTGPVTSDGEQPDVDTAGALRVATDPYAWDRVDEPAESDSFEEAVAFLDEENGEVFLPLADAEDEEPVPILSGQLTLIDDTREEPAEARTVMSSPLAQPALAAETLDDLGALLRQMDETLSMIRSVRAKAA